MQLASARSPRDSLARLEALLSRSRVEAGLVLLPEYSDVNPLGLGPEELRRLALPLGDNPFVKGLERLSTEYSAVIVAGVLEKSGSCVYSSVVAARNGGYEVLHRKHMLFDALGYRESSILCRGPSPRPAGEWGGHTVGAIVCYELRFPELARQLALQGVDLLLVPAAWYAGPLKEEQLEVLARARALENTMYVAVADQAAEGFAARSMLVDPLGVKRLDLGSREAYAEVDTEPGLVEEARRLLPVLQQARLLLEEPEHREKHVGGDTVDAREG